MEQVTVRKRDGRVVDFDTDTVIRAVSQAYKQVQDVSEVSPDDMRKIADIATVVESQARNYNNGVQVPVADIQNYVEHALLNAHEYDIAQAYTQYRLQRDIDRAKATDVNEAVSRFLKGDKSITNENANKDSNVYAVQRDLLAGAVSKSAFNKLAPKDVSNGHNKGDIHFHDSDYALSYMTNCSLPNFKDMLANGFVLGNAQMGTAHSIGTASTQLTQIIQQIASAQYGGQTVNRIDEVLAPYAMKDFAKNYEQARLIFPDDVDLEYADNLLKEMKAKEAQSLHTEGREPIIDVADENITDEVEKRRNIYCKITTRKNIYDSMQTMEYQTNTAFSACGQTPFVTLGFGLGTSWASKEITRCIFLIRIQGLGEDHRTAIFPKLTYAIKEGVNANPDDPQYDMKQLALECSSKRMYPDILNYNAIVNVTGSFKAPMGAVAGYEVITYKDSFGIHTTDFKHFWDTMALRYPVKSQGTNGDDWYMDVPRGDIFIKDTHTGIIDWVNVQRIINNQPRDWARRITFKGGRTLDVTCDHPFEVEGRGRVLTDDIVAGDKVKDSLISYAHLDGDEYSAHAKYTAGMAWALGVLITDGCLSESSETTVSFAYEGENEIRDKFVNLFGENSIRETVYNRGRHGVYREIAIKDSNLHVVAVSEFGATLKDSRNVPSHFTTQATTDERLNFLAGVIDGDGHVNKSGRVQIGSIRKSLALGEMLVARSLGYEPKIYASNYGSKDNSKTRWVVEFFMDELLARRVQCAKKKIVHVTRTPHYAQRDNFIREVVRVEELTIPLRTYDVTTDSDYFDVSGMTSHNCRSFLQAWDNPTTGEDESDGRMNLGVVSVNIPRVSLESKGDIKRFWKILDQKLEIAHHALVWRIERVRQATPLNAPVLWQYGAFGRLSPTGNVWDLMKNKRSTISLGYVGLYETVAYFYGKYWVNDWGWDSQAKDFEESIIEHLKDKCLEWTGDGTGPWFSLYGTPAESLAGRFNALDRERFGSVEGVTDHDFYTNSFHRPVWLSGWAEHEPSQAELDVMNRESFHTVHSGGIASKFEFEGNAPLLGSSGGYITYVEYPTMRDNLKGLEAMWDYARMLGVPYVATNTPIDKCFECGYEGDFTPTNTGYMCPHCGNDDPNTTDVTKRTCGYLGNPVQRPMAYGRQQDLAHRAKNLSGQTGKVTLANGDTQEFYEDRSFTDLGH